MTRTKEDPKVNRFYQRTGDISPDEAAREVVGLKKGGRIGSLFNNPD
jgi:hypothetical protein